MSATDIIRLLILISFVRMEFAMLIEVRCYPPLIKGYLMLIFRSGKLPYLLVPSKH